MRMRKKKHAGERIQACENYLRWEDMFAGGKPAHLEIGCGKGDFICVMAQRYPGVNFIAVEKISNVVVTAIEKVKSLDLPNARFLIVDAKKLAECFGDNNKVSRIYLNFSDPWPKRYQQNNRLTSPSFLEIYKKIMAPGSKIILKTDKKDFFDYSIKSFSSNGFIIENQTYDLYDSEFLDVNVQTEYEKNFVAQGIKICYLEVIRENS